MIVGRNPQIADPPQWMSLKQAKARGARVLVIDPFQTTAAEMADLWLRPRPGTDGAIALAMTKVLIDEDLYDRATWRNWCHGFDELAQRVSTCTPAVGRQRPACRPQQIVEAARMFARGPSSFISGHGIDATSNGVQTFRAYYCLFAISGNVDRVGGQPAAEAAEGLQDLFRRPVRPGLPPRPRDRGTAHRRCAVSAVGRPARLPDGLPQPLGDRGDPDRPALSGARRSMPAASTSRSPIRTRSARSKP